MTFDQISTKAPSEMSVPELKAHMERLQRELERKREVEVDEFIERVRKDATAYNLSPRELAKRLTARSDDNGAAASPKYVDPADQQNTWSGKGKKPNWVKAYLESGRTLESLAAPVTPPASGADDNDSGSEAAGGEPALDNRNAEAA